MRRNSFSRGHERFLAAQVNLVKGARLGFEGDGRTHGFLFEAINEIIQLAGALEDEGLIPEGRDYRRLLTELDRLRFPHEFE